MPRWKELKRFCEKDGWELYKETDHYFYRKIDDNGEIRFTKVSKGSGEIHSHMWKEILKKQLKVTQEYFNKKYDLRSCEGSDGNGENSAAVWDRSFRTGT